MSIDEMKPWPEFTTAYSHNPISYVDLALAQAEAADEFYGPMLAM